MGRGPGMGMGMNQGRLLADEALAAVLVESELNLVSRGRGSAHRRGTLKYHHGSVTFCSQFGSFMLPRAGTPKSQGKAFVLFRCVSRVPAEFVHVGL